MKNYKNTALYARVCREIPNYSEESKRGLYRYYKARRRAIVDKIACAILYPITGALSLFAIAAIVCAFINCVIL